MVLFKKISAFVVGDIMLDEFIETRKKGISQEYVNNPVLQVLNRNFYLGGAANVALNLKKMGADVALLGTVGVDKFQEILYALLLENEISNEYLVANPKQHTTLKSRLLQDGNPILRTDEETDATYDKAIDDYLLFNFKEILDKKRPDIIILQDYNKGVLNAYLIPIFLELAQEKNIPVCVDPKFENWQLYKNVDIFKPNRRELAFMNDSDNEPETNDNIEYFSQKVIKKIGCKNLFVTLGAQGSFLMNADSSFFTASEKFITHPDVCGAGDTVIAVLAMAYASGIDWLRTAELANKAANCVCHKSQIQPISLDELTT